MKFLAFVLLCGLFSLTPVYERIVSAAVTEDATLSGAVLNILGEHVRVSNGTISSPRYVITVLPACSAFEYLWFFCGVVLAFPARLSRKFAGILVGAPLLLALNLLRVISLYYIGAHFPRFFDVTHEQLWGILLVLGSVSLYAAWIAWAREEEPIEPNVQPNVQP